MYIGTKSCDKRQTTNNHKYSYLSKACSSSRWRRRNTHGLGHSDRKAASWPLCHWMRGSSCRKWAGAWTGTGHGTHWAAAGGERGLVRGGRRGRGWWAEEDRGGWWGVRGGEGVGEQRKIEGVGEGRDEGREGKEAGEQGREGKGFVRGKRRGRRERLVRSRRGRGMVGDQGRGKGKEVGEGEEEVLWAVWGMGWGVWSSVVGDSEGIEEGRDREGQGAECWLSVS